MSHFAPRLALVPGQLIGLQETPDSCLLSILGKPRSLMPAHQPRSAPDSPRYRWRACAVDGVSLRPVDLRDITRYLIRSELVTGELRHLLQCVFIVAACPFGEAANTRVRASSLFAHPQLLLVGCMLIVR